MTQSRARAATVLAFAAFSLASAPSALAMAGSDSDGNAASSGTYDVSSPARSNYAVDISRGLEVLGDSLSMSPGAPAPWVSLGPRNQDGSQDTSGGSQMAPYLAEVSRRLQHKRAVVRARGGFTVADIEHQYGWGSNPFTTGASDPAATNAGVVFVELGTNDMSCFHLSSGMPGYSTDPSKNTVDGATKNVCDAYFSNTIPNEQTNPSGYTAWRDDQRGKIARQVLEVISKIRANDPNRCIVWAGPREVNLYGATVADNRWFNSILRSASTNNWFHFVDLTAYTAQNAALQQDWGRKWDGSYQVHLETSAGADALAKLAVDAASAAPTARSSVLPYGGCGLS